MDRVFMVFDLVAKGSLFDLLFSLSGVDSRRRGLNYQGPPK